MSKLKPGKVAIIGCGFVGSASAFALMQSGLFTEMVLLDANHQKAEGEAEDIVHGIPFGRPMQIYAGDYDDIADAAIIVITAGANQKPDETRLDLVNKNIAIFQSIIPEITNSSDCCKSGRYSDLHGAETVRLSGKPGNWFRNCAGFCQTEVSSGTASGSGQQKCTCFYRGRTRGQ